MPSALLPPRQRRPVRLPALAAVLSGALLLALIQINVLSFTFGRLGLSPGWGFAVLLTSLVGGAVNIPVTRITAQPMQPWLRWTPFGCVLTVVPARSTILAVNVGGALVPLGLSSYLLVTTHVALSAAIGVAVVALVVHRFARVVPEVGVVLPAFWPALSACIVTLLLHPSASAALAYISGTVGTLIGADLTNLRHRRDGHDVRAAAPAGRRAARPVPRVGDVRGRAELGPLAPQPLTALPLSRRAASA